MPTLRSMIDEFTKSSYEYRDKNVKKILLGNESYSLIMQDSISNILEKNIIKTTNKTMLNTYIYEAVRDSLQIMKRFNDKTLGKKIFNEMADFLNEVYAFNIDLTGLDEVVIGTPEERCLYLLRETERQNDGGEKKSIADIAGELGCSTRALQKDVKKMTEEGFKLLGLNIKLIDEGESILQMESTPHPVILMQNISQLFVMLEGLRAMEKINAFSSFSIATSCSIWNQLTKYARLKIMDAAEELGENQESITWYFDLDNVSNEYNCFLTEIENCDGNISSQLMYLGKNGGIFNITFIDNNGNETTINECRIHHYNPYEGKAILETLNGEYEIEDKKIMELEII